MIEKIQHGTKFVIDGNYNMIYQYSEAKSKMLKEIGMYDQYSFITVMYTLEQCNVVLFTDYMLVYKFIGLIQLETKIELNRLTILN